MKIMVEVTHLVEVELDEMKFTAEFISEFRSSFYGFKTIEEHACHLAQLQTRGLVDEHTSFIEGYGPPKDMGIGFGKADFYQADVLWKTNAGVANGKRTEGRLATEERRKTD